jgi:hypothetical protein
MMLLALHTTLLTQLLAVTVAEPHCGPQRDCESCRAAGCGWCG